MRLKEEFSCNAFEGSPFPDIYTSTQQVASAVGQP
jgi:hypothetical protein